MSQLRVALPPLAELELHSEVSCAWLDRQGQVSREERLTLSQLGQRPKQPSLLCFLHPADSLLASLDLPPLPAGKIVAAVQCAAQALMLGDSSLMHIGHSPRDASGRVQIAWLSRQHLQRLAAVLKQSGLSLSGLYPAPYSLPVSSDVVVCVRDGHLLKRESLHHAQVDPLLGDDVEQASFEPEATQRWTGPLPGWGLHGGLQQTGGEQRGWGRAAGCVAVAVAVWVIGLNLYAAREARQGQQLKAQMSQRVKQAFPELPVILNPLQQARQQLEQRQKGAVDDPAHNFNRLVLQAGTGMPFMAGSVERLTYRDGALQLALLSDARRGGKDKDWQSTLAQAGISVSADDEGWTLRPAGEATANENTTEDDSSGADDE